MREESPEVAWRVREAAEKKKEDRPKFPDWCGAKDRSKLREMGWGTRSSKISRLLWGQRSSKNSGHRGGKRSFKIADLNDLGVSKSEGGRSSKNRGFWKISVYSQMDLNDLRVSKSEGGRSSKFIMLQTEIF